jgi:alcohol dehydrogenase class IV
MDAAKGIAFMSVNSGDITEYIFGKPGIGALPIITVTTTAGTGSEGDCLAVLTNPETKDKKSLKSPFIYPRVSIVDPELMKTLPRGMIAATGVDALAHSIEAYVARRGNPVTEALAIKAIELVGKNLTRVYSNPQDIEAWHGMAIANTFGGMVIDSAGVALPHGLEHPISGLLNVTHGEGLAAIFIKWMEYTIDEAEEKFAKIAEALGEDIYGISIGEAAKKSIDAISKLLKALNLTPTLGELGVKEEHVDWLTENALKTMTYAISNNPKVPDGEKIKELYLSCI